MRVELDTSYGLAILKKIDHPEKYITLLALEMPKEAKEKLSFSVSRNFAQLPHVVTLYADGTWRFNTEVEV